MSRIIEKKVNGRNYLIANALGLMMEDMGIVAFGEEGYVFEDEVMRQAKALIARVFRVLEGYGADVNDETLLNETSFLVNEFRQRVFAVLTGSLDESIVMQLPEEIDMGNFPEGSPQKILSEILLEIANSFFSLKEMDNLYKKALANHEI